MQHLPQTHFIREDPVLVPRMQACKPLQSLLLVWPKDPSEQKWLSHRRLGIPCDRRHSIMSQMGFHGALCFVLSNLRAGASIDILVVRGCGCEWKSVFGNRRSINITFKTYWSV